MKSGQNVRPEDYIVVSAFMIHDLKLKGIKLLVYAMIYGYSKNNGGCFYGSMGWLAAWLGVSERAARQLVKELEDEKLIIQIGKHRQGSHETRKYIINQAAIDTPLDQQEESSPEKTSYEDSAPEKTSGDHRKKVPVTAEKTSGDYNSNIYNNNIFNNIEDNLVPSPSSKAGSAIQEIFEYFTAQTNKRIETTDDDIALVQRWLAKGYTVDDCKRVIDVKSHQWLNDVKMHEWVRIRTLFGDKFPKYVEEPLPLEVKYREYEFRV